MEQAPDNSGKSAVKSSDEPLSILMAEDNPVNQLTATTMFKKLGHTVEVADNGLQAIEKLNGGAFDIVFMDVQMPEMDGMAATAQIREQEQSSTAHVPIVAMTAHAMKGDKEKCLEAGMDDYISKPIRRKELANVIERVRERFLQRPDDPAEGKPAMIDAEALLEECDHDIEMLSQMVSIFNEDTKNRITLLQDAVAGGNANVVKEEAHALKGGIGNFFADSVFETAYTLENMGASGDLSGAAPVLQTLQEELRGMRQELAELVKQ